MRNICCKPGFKSVSAILQGMLAGVLVLCFLNAFYWLEGNFSVSEMGKSFEETGVFLQRVEDTVRAKISYDRNRALFETDGEYDGERLVDIRQYMAGVSDEANQNRNTSYLLQDLIAFSVDGMPQLRGQLQKLIGSGLSDQEIGERLFAQSMVLEKILPVSGNSLSTYARMNVNPDTAIQEYYQNLCDASREIGRRYQEYQTSLAEPEGEQNSEAPSNIAYFIENTNTRERYTNLGVKSFPAAQRLVQSSGELEALYEGERRFNIMVANSEYVMNEAAERWFISTRFLGSGEKVLLAVNVGYPISDGLQTVYQAFERREPTLVASAAVGAASLALLLVLLALSVTVTGRSVKGGPTQLNGFDRIPTEIAAGLCLIAALILYIVADMRLSRISSGYASALLMAALFAGEYWIFLFSLLSLTRRRRERTLWDNSVCYAVLLGCRQVYSARRTSGQLLIGYVIFFVLNLVFLGFLRMPGVVMALVMDMAVLLYLMRDEVGKQSVREGLDQISRGHLDYKIDTKVLTGESLQMAEAVNDMGDGLQEAIDSMLKNERMKAELITNVSHDIKTPLTSIINYVDLLKREPLPEGRAREYLSVLEQKSQRLKQLMEDLIEASRINSGSVELHCEELTLQQMLQQAYGEFDERLREQQLEAVLSLPKEPVRIYADGRQLWRVFENLLGNIVKYAMRGTRVYLELRETDGLAEVTFKNVSGQKLEADAEELQERFVRGDPSRNTEGSGLGLSIAKSLTELMDGTFEVILDGDLFRVTLLFPVR